MKLEVGMYIRTKKYGIHKISEIDERKTIYKYICDYRPHEDGDGTYTYSIYADKDILKANHNIKYLIEVGDIVEVEFDNNNGINKFEVVGVDVETNEIGIFKDDYSIHIVDIKNIKSIVTKEQFEAIQYKVV